MARKKFTYRGNAVIGTYPEDPDIGYKVGQNGLRVKLCDTKALEGMNDAEKYNELMRIYFRKEVELRQNQQDEKLVKSKQKKAKKSATLREVSKLWISEVIAIKSERSAKEYKATMDLYFKTMGDHPVSEFDRAMNIKFLKALSNTLSTRKDELISANTQHKHMRHLRTLINWCYASEYIDRQHIFVMPKTPEKEMETYEPSQVKDLENFLTYQTHGPLTRDNRIRNTNLLRAFMLARNTLLRTGAIWSLPLENISLESRTIKIRDVEKLKWQSKGYKWPNKPINDTFYKFLEMDLKNRNPEEVYFLDKGNGQPWHVDVAGVTNAMKKCCNTLGLPNIKPFHWGIRATFITWLLNEGVPQVQVQHLADHSSITTTMKYFNTRKNNQASAANLLG